MGDRGGGPESVVGNTLSMPEGRELSHVEIGKGPDDVEAPWKRISLKYWYLGLA